MFFLLFLKLFFFYEKINSKFGDTFGFLVMGVAILHHTKSWEFCFILSSSVLLLMAFFNLIFLNPYPKEVGFNLI
jgi:sugar phosphate permease